MEKLKCLFFFFIGALAVSALCSTAAMAKEEKIGSVDVALLFDSYNKTKDQDALLTSKSDQKKAERDKMVDKIRNLKNELELLADNQKQKKQEQIDEEVRKLQDFDRETKIALERERDNMVRSILKEIDGVIQEFAQKQGYTIILNSRVLVYGQKEIDLTQQVLELLNSRYKK